MKSKRQIEKVLWPFVRPSIDLSSQDGHAEYVKFQREFQKRLTEQLKHNPVTVSDLVFRVDIVATDVQKLLQMNMSLKRKGQKR